MTLPATSPTPIGPEGIRVNHFNVGWTLTPNEYAMKMKEGLPDDWPTAIPEDVAPSGRILSPEDVAMGRNLFSLR